MCRLTGSHRCWTEWPANHTQDHIIRIRKIIFCLSNDAPSHVVGIYTSTLDGKYYCNITPTASDRVSTVTHLYSLWDDDGSVCANVTSPTWQTMETSAFIVMARFGGVGRINGYWELCSCRCAAAAVARERLIYVHICIIYSSGTLYVIHIISMCRRASNIRAHRWFIVCRMLALWYPWTPFVQQIPKHEMHSNKCPRDIIHYSYYLLKLEKRPIQTKSTRLRYRVLSSDCPSGRGEGRAHTINI